MVQMCAESVWLIYVTIVANLTFSDDIYITGNYTI